MRHMQALSKSMVSALDALTAPVHSIGVNYVLTSCKAQNGNEWKNTERQSLLRKPPLSVPLSQHLVVGYYSVLCLIKQLNKPNGRSRTGLVVSHDATPTCPSYSVIKPRTCLFQTFLSAQVWRTHSFQAALSVSVFGAASPVWARKS